MERFVLMNPKIIIKNNINYPTHSFCFIYYITHPNKSSHFISTSHGKLKMDQIKACLHGGGRPQIGEVTGSGSPHLSHKRVVKLKRKSIWTGRLPQLPGVPHLHVNRPKESHLRKKNFADKIIPG